MSREPDQNLLLVQSMGASYYEPLPTEQITCFLDEEFTLTPRGHRYLAVLRQFTVVKGERTSRSGYAREHGRRLTEKELGAKIGLDHSASLKVWAELVQKGLARKDENRRLWLCGKVVPSGRIEGEDYPGFDEEEVWKKFCTDNLPGYLALHFQSLEKNERRQARTDIEALDSYGKKVLAEVMAKARAAVQKQKDQALAERYGAKVRRHKPKPKPETDPEPEPKAAAPSMVQLALLSFPLLSVQNFAEDSVHDQNPGVYSVENDSVQPIPPISDLLEVEIELASSSPEENELEQAIEERLQQSRLKLVGGRERDPSTVRNIRKRLERLPDAHQRREVLDILEDKCREFHRQSDKARRITWGYIVGIVEQEVINRVGKPPDLGDMIRNAAAAKGMR